MLRPVAEDLVKKGARRLLRSRRGWPPSRNSAKRFLTSVAPPSKTIRPTLVMIPSLLAARCDRASARVGNGRQNSAGQPLLRAHETSGGGRSPGCGGCCFLRGGVGGVPTINTPPVCRPSPP